MEKGELAKKIADARTAFKSGNVPTEGDFTGLIDAVENGGFVKGMIMMFAGKKADVPAGWALCDGSQAPAPDLSGRFIVGEDAEHMGTRRKYSEERMPLNAPQIAVKTASFTASIVGSTEKTALTIHQLPSHHHVESTISAGMYEDGTFATVNPGTFRYETEIDRAIIWADQEPDPEFAVAKFDIYDKKRILGNRQGSQAFWHAFRMFAPRTSFVGNDEGHAHAIKSLRITPDASTNFTVAPPYYALAFIMKL